MSIPAPAQRSAPGPGFWLAVTAFLYFPALYQHGYRALQQAQADFPSFHLGALAVLTGGVSPYDVEGIRALAVSQGLDQHVFPFLYPPVSLLPLLPLGMLSYPRAALLFMVASQLALLVGAWLACRRLLPGTWHRSNLLELASLGYFFLFAPTLETLDLGQNNLFAFVCVTGAWIAMRERRADALAGVLLAVACLFKLYLVLLLGAALLLRRVRVALWGAGALTALTALSFLVLPASTWPEWLGRVAPTGGYGGVPHGLFSPADPVNQSLAGFFARLFLPEDAPLASHVGLCVPLTWAAALATLAASVWGLLRTRRRADLPFELDVGMSVALLAIYLVAPFSWDHHLVSIACVAMVAACRAAGGDPAAGLSAVERVAVVAAVLAVAWELPMGAPFMKHGVGVLAGSAKFFAVAVLWVSFVARAAAPRRPRAA